MRYLGYIEALKVKAFIEEQIKAEIGTGFIVEDSDTEYPQEMQVQAEDRLDGAEIYFSEFSRTSSFNWEYAGVESLGRDNQYTLMTWGEPGVKVEEIMEKARDYAEELTGREIILDCF